jgi:N-acetylated-alpha-linked acidic dipeptidase
MLYNMPNEQTPLLAVVRVEGRKPRYRHSTVRRFCTIVLSTTLAIILFCFLLPVAFLPALNGPKSSYLPWARSLPNKAWPESDGMTYEELQEIILSTPNEVKAREWSEYYTAGPHLAGKNLSQAIWTKDRWADFGVKSSIVAYDVYLNYPRDHRLALLEIDSNVTDIGTDQRTHKLKHECSLEEDVLEKDGTTGLQDRIPTFHGYSASGNVTAPFVYVNFGTHQDFEDLLAANVALKGKIAIAKYEHGFRGLKVKRAQELGMVAMVIYSDPQQDGEVTKVNGYKAYPEGPARNPSSVQRGSVQFISPYLQIGKANQADRCCRRSARRPNHSRNTIKAGLATC